MKDIDILRGDFFCWVVSMLAWMMEGGWGVGGGEGNYLRGYPGPGVTRGWLGGFGGAPRLERSLPGVPGTDIPWHGPGMAATEYGSGTASAWLPGWQVFHSSLFPGTGSPRTQGPPRDHPRVPPGYPRAPQGRPQEEFSYRVYLWGPPKVNQGTPQPSTPRGTPQNAPNQHHHFLVFRGNLFS